MEKSVIWRKIPGSKNSQLKGHEPFGMFEVDQETGVAEDRYS